MFAWWVLALMLLHPSIGDVAPPLGSDNLEGLETVLPPPLPDVHNNDEDDLPFVLGDVLIPETEDNANITDVAMPAMSLPSHLCITVKAIFNNDFANCLKAGSHGDPYEVIEEVFREANNAYGYNGLPVKVTLRLNEIVREKDPKARWRAQDMREPVDGRVRPEDVWLNHVSIHRNYYVDASFGHYTHFTCDDDKRDKHVAKAWGGSACSSSGRHKASVVEWTETAKITGQIVAHEIGHTLGILDDVNLIDGRYVDRYARDGTTPCSRINSVMYYNRLVDKWSRCSYEDLESFLMRKGNKCRRLLGECPEVKTEKREAKSHCRGDYHCFPPGKPPNCGVERNRLVTCRKQCNVDKGLPCPPCTDRYPNECNISYYRDCEKSLNYEGVNTRCAKTCGFCYA